MADIIPVARNFDQGFQSDVSRDQLGPSAAFRLRDYIPELEAPLRKRGGWSFASPDYASISVGCNGVTSIGWLPFPNDGHLVATLNNGATVQQKRFDGLGGTVIASTGAALAPTQGIFWHKDRGIILEGLNQVAAVPNKYFDTGGLVYTVASIGGTPPLARMGFSWGDYLVLGNYFEPSSPTTLNSFRWAFSAVGNPDSWTLTGANASTMDFPEEMIAGLPVRNAILAWGYRDCHIVTGDTPPPGGNLTRKVLFAGQGTFDGRSVAAWRDQAVWANAGGVFMSDGATLTDLTYTGGISVYYRQKVSGFAFSQGWIATGGIYRDHYVLTITNAALQVVTTLVCDLTRRVWTEWTNFPGGVFAHRPAGPGTTLYGGDEELFMARPNVTANVASVSSLWTPSAALDSDANGVDVLPSIETGFYKLGTDALKRMRRMFLGYDIRTSGGTPLLAVSYVVSPEVGLAYTPLNDQYPTTTRYKRKQGRIGRIGLGVGLKIDQVGPSADTRIYDLGIEAHPMDATRAGV
jgi:hypothetical protein